MSTSAINLAFVGDAIYDLYIRVRLLADNKTSKVNVLNSKKIKYVSAKAQAKIINEIMHELNEEEIKTFKRGRNAKSKSSPKGSKITDYRNATGFEALIGHLYLKEKKERMTEILDKAYELVEDEKKDG